MKTHTTTHHVFRRLGLRTAVPALLIACAPAITLAEDPTLDQLLDLDPPTEQPTQKPDAGQGDAAEDADAALKKTLAEMREKAAADYKKAANALEEAVNDMDDVADRLQGKRDPSLPTQRMQEDIIKKIDQMIAAAQQQQQQQQSSSSSSSSSSSNSDSQSESQAQQSSSSSSPSSNPSGSQANQGSFSPGSVKNVGDTQKPLEELKQEWGQLPPRQREELSEGLNEQFNPIYRLLTESYYRRIAEDAGQE